LSYIQYGVLFQRDWPAFDGLDPVYHAYMDVCTFPTKGEALEFAFKERESQPLSIFSVNLQSGEVATSVTRQDLEDFLRRRKCEESPLRLAHSSKGLKPSP
jgi:hypothetical protein